MKGRDGSTVWDRTLWSWIRPGAARAVAGAAVALALAAGLAAAACGGGEGDPDRRTVEGEARPEADVLAAEGPQSADPAAGDARTQSRASPSHEGAGDDWPTYGGTVSATRFSRLADVHPGNVDRLERAWSYRTGVRGIFEATPLVVDGAMYLSTPVAGGEQRVVKLDAATGDPIWETTLSVEAGRAHPVRVNRGVALHRGRVYLATLDARLVALDAGSGEVAWEVRTSDPGRGYQHKQAPLAHHGRVYLGVSGGPLGIRGFVKAFDAGTGEELWTWHVVPSPAEGGWWGEWRETLPGTDVPLPRDLDAERADSARHADSWRRGGGAPWMTPTLDPERGLLFVGTGNPAPELTDDTRPGDNRWTSSVCAIRADVGATAWCWQLVPHDLWGVDAASPPFLFPRRAADEPPGPEAAASGGGRSGTPSAAASTPAVGHFSKLGLFYAWDRRSGELLALSENYVPHRNFLARPTPEGVTMAPGIYGGTEWSPAAWSPATGLAYAAALHAPGRYHVRTEGPRAGTVGFELGPAGERWGKLVAVDPATGEVAWEDRTERPLVGGVLATAGGLVFAGRLSGALTAWDAETGERLWSGDTGPGCASGPVTYRAGGRQYVAVACGGHFLGGGRGDRVVAFALPDDVAPDADTGDPDGDAVDTAAGGSDDADPPAGEARETDGRGRP